MAFRGAGAALQSGDGASPEVFTAIGEVIEVTGPSQTNDEFETTHLGSTAKEFLAALKDNGSCEFEAHFNPSNTQQDNLWADAASGATRSYRIVWSDPASSPDPYVEFTAFVSNLSMATPPNDSVKISGSLRITGALTKNF